MKNCNNIINTPIVQEDDPCNGEKVFTTCVIEQSALSALNLPANSTQAEVNAAIQNALINLEQNGGSDDYVISGVLDSDTGLVTFTRDSGDTFDVDLIALLGTSTVIEGTYNEINNLVINNELIPGVTYIITDYQTKYFIDGSNSSGILQFQTIASLVSGWAVFESGYVYDINVGDTVTITELPSGYSGSLQVGDVTTVSQESQDYYFRFTNGMQNVVGLKFSYSYQRYSTVADDTITNDINGKPVMIPNGVINTQVHDGTPYMDMSGAENTAPPIERIVLKAKSTNAFYADGESDTFQDDRIVYDFDNTDIINDNSQVIGQRKGLVTRRSTTDNQIDLPIDWRAYRFRRWQLDDASITQFINKNQDVNTARTAASGQYIYTSRHRSTSTPEAFYIALNPEQVFKSLDENAFVENFTIVTSSLISAKDFNVIPIDSSYEPVGVQRITVLNSYFQNTVFQGVNNGEFNYNLLLQITNGGVSNSTFVSHTSLTGGFGLNIIGTTVLDSINGTIDNTTFNGCQLLSHVYANSITSSEFQNTIFGTLNANINGMQDTYAWVSFHRLVAVTTIDSALGNRSAFTSLTNVRIVDSNVFFGSSWTPGDEDGLYQTEVVFIDSCVFSYMSLRLLNRNEQVLIRGFLQMDNRFSGANGSNPNIYRGYDLTTNMYQTTLELNTVNRDIYKFEVDASYQTQFTVMATPTIL